MKINDVGLKFTNETGKRKSTTAIVLHHADANGCTVQDIHRWHLNNGWAGIGYHFYVRKDGSVYQGRPIDWVGAHAGSSSGYNSKSIGICFEGKYHSLDKAMPDAQLKAGQELVSYCKSKYPSIKEVKKHSECTSTSCPGQYFPFAKIAAGTSTANATSTKSSKVDSVTKVVAKSYKNDNIKDANGTKNEYAYATIADVKAQKPVKAIGYMTPNEKGWCYAIVDGYPLISFNTTSKGRKVGFGKYMGGVKKFTAPSFTWQNGSTIEKVYCSVKDCKAGTNSIGSLNPKEKATCYGRVDGCYIVVYTAGSTKKVGFVKYAGGVK